MQVSWILKWVQLKEAHVQHPGTSSNMYKRCSWFQSWISVIKYIFIKHTKQKETASNLLGEIDLTHWGVFFFFYWNHIINHFLIEFKFQRWPHAGIVLCWNKNDEMIPSSYQLRGNKHTQTHIHICIQHIHTYRHAHNRFSNVIQNGSKRLEYSESNKL